MYADEMIGGVCHWFVTTITPVAVNALTTGFRQLACPVCDRGVGEVAAFLGR